MKKIEKFQFTNGTEGKREWITCEKCGRPKHKDRDCTCKDENFEK